jgi:DNA-binding HxlR family transcriptional regulator
MAAPTRALSQAHQQILVTLRRGPARWRDLHRAIRPKNDPTLAEYLHRLVRDKLIIRHMISAGPPARVEYSLSQLGREIADHAVVLLEWNERDARAASQVEGARSAA